MTSVCVLTDSTAQFIKPAFPGIEYVLSLPVRTRVNGNIFGDFRDLKASGMPSTLRGDFHPRLIPPSEKDFLVAFQTLEQKFQEIVVLLSSRSLSAAYFEAEAALSHHHGSAAIQIIDSQTTSIGLGLLVQLAAAKAKSGASGADVCRTIRGALQKVYSVFCIQGLSYLASAGFLDSSQAVIGEMLGVTSLYNLERGKLVPVHKIRNSRQLLEILFEFVSEFSNLSYVALLHDPQIFDQESRHLRDRLISNFPAVTVSEHPLNLHLATIFGPSSLGVIALEDISPSS
jgi:DegV family protein with EDD domain